MRFVPAFLGALVITALVFLFMQSLIESRREADLQLPVHPPVEIIREKKAEIEPEQQPEQQQEPEPALEQLQVPVLSPLSKIELEVPALDLANGDLQIAVGGGSWSAPLSTGAADVLDGQGIGAQGFVEVVPYGTRKPNVPELAWKNKINGWVLVAFNVTPQGSTKNIRVLDASPRGVFEEKVIAAVEDWKYSVRFFSSFEGEVVLTQKVEVEWKDFHKNMPDLD